MCCGNGDVLIENAAFQVVRSPPLNAEKKELNEEPDPVDEISAMRPERTSTSKLTVHAISWIELHLEIGYGPELLLKRSRTGFSDRDDV